MRELLSSLASQVPMDFAWRLLIRLSCGPMEDTIFRLKSSSMMAGRWWKLSPVTLNISNGLSRMCQRDPSLVSTRPRCLRKISNRNRSILRKQAFSLFPQESAWSMRFGQTKSHRCPRKKFGFLMTNTRDRAFKINISNLPRKWVRMATCWSSRLWMILPGC